MSDDFLRRLEAVERAVSDGHTDLTAVSDAADTAERLARVEARVDDLEAELAALDGRLQAIRGYLSGVDGVSADVEQRADLALAKVTKLETMVVDERDGLVVERLPGSDGWPPTHRTAETDPDDSDTDNSGWAAQAAARLSRPSESALVVGTSTVADTPSEGSRAASDSAAQLCSESRSDTAGEASDSDGGADGSLVGHLRGALGQ